MQSGVFDVSTTEGFIDAFATIASSMDDVVGAIVEAAFIESQLADEELFLLYNFPVHYTPTATEVTERYEELMEQWIAYDELARMFMEDAVEAMVDL